MKLWLIFPFFFYIQSSTLSQVVNPCIALKLPLCKLRKDFVASNRIKTTTPRPPAAITSIRTRPAVVVRPRPSNSGDCKGLRFCVLKKDEHQSNPRPFPQRPTKPTTITIATPASTGPSLMSAVLNGHIETAYSLIAEGADVNAADVHGNSVLHVAAQNGRDGVIDDLLLNGARVNQGNNHRNVALHLAAQNGWTEVTAKLLRAKKIKVNAIDLHANTALHLAAQNGQIGVTRLLLERPEIVLNKPNTHGMIPLHLAAQNGHLELSRMLVLAGSDLDYPDLIGNTPLHTAVHTSHSKIANMLVQAGANKAKRNKSGLTASQLGK